MNTGSSRWESLRFFSGLAVAPICLLLVGCGPSEQQLKEEAERKSKEAQIAQTEVLKSYVLDRLIDPASAQFRKVKLLPGDKGLCGELNSKNKLGGYVGFSAFAVDPSGKTVILKVMTLDLAKRNLTMEELALAVRNAGNPTAGDALIRDSVDRLAFAHWRECAD